MKNKIFELKFNTEKGGITWLSLVGDENNMNFIKDGGALGSLPNFDLVSSADNQSSIIAQYQKRGVEINAKYEFVNDKLYLSYDIKNKNDYPVYFKDGDLKIDFAFFDCYTDSETCMKKRCHEHIFAGEEFSFINAERMGLSEYNIGLIVEKGSMASYYQNGCKSNDRGALGFNVSKFNLLSGENIEIKFSIFTHIGGDDFSDKLFEYGFPQIETKGFTALITKEKTFTIKSKEKITQFSCKFDGQVKTVKKVDGLEVSINANSCGEKYFYFTLNGKKSHIRFFFHEEISNIIEKRIKFIVEKQQCMDENSPLYGAYLIYDNEENCQFFDNVWRDYNASRERLGMGILIAEYLKTHSDEKIEKSFELFKQFCEREFIDVESGSVYDTIGKNAKYLRLYNAPWAILFYSVLYQKEKKEIYIKNVATILRKYYLDGGAKFYPNGVRFKTFFEVLKGTKYYDEIFPMFMEHVNNIVKNGIIYPPHEVNYEQTIVTPAVSILLDAYELTDDKFYLSQAELHLSILAKFEGSQPDYSLYKVPIRYWDGYWFGKTHIFGDIMPHYWSALSGECFYRYGKLTNDDKSIVHGIITLKSNLCSFFNDGSASCAYYYSDYIDGLHGKRFDEFANDQDFALYFILNKIDSIN